MLLKHGKGAGVCPFGVYDIFVNLFLKFARGLVPL
jgi:hypothetical protein